MQLIVCLVTALAAAPAEPVKDLLAAAWAATEQGNFVEGEALLGRARRMAPGEGAESVELVAGHERDLGFPRKAEQTYRAAIAGAAGRPEQLVKLHTMLGAHLAAAGRTIDAIHEFEQALSLPGQRYHHQILSMLAPQYEEAGEIAKAESAIRRKLAVEPTERLIVTTGLAGECGLRLLGMNATRNELAEFFTRTGRIGDAERQLRLALDELPAGADLRARAGALLALKEHLETQGDQATADRIESKLRMLAAAARTQTDREAALDLRITLARQAGEGAKRAEYAAIREEARALLGTQAWQYTILGGELGIPPDPPLATGVQPAAVPAPPPPTPAPLPSDPVALAREAAPFRPALLKRIARDGAFRGEREWLPVLEQLPGSDGPEAELELVKLRLQSPLEDEERMSLRARQFVLIEQLQGPNARGLVRLALDLAQNADDDWERALPLWRRHVDLARRFHGPASREHIGGVLAFAHDAGWAEQYTLAFELVDQAARLARGNRDLEEAAGSVRKTILDWKRQE